MNEVSWPRTQHFGFDIELPTGVEILLILYNGGTRCFALKSRRSFVSALFSHMDGIL